MNESSSGTTSNILLYNTPAGHKLVKEIVSEHLPYEPHDYQTDGVCAVLNGRDLLATMATGSGKTGFFMMLMVVVRTFASNPSRAHSGKTVYPQVPAMILVCPTKALQVDMVSGLSVIIFVSRKRKDYLRQQR